MRISRFLAAFGVFFLVILLAQSFAEEAQDETITYDGMTKEETEQLRSKAEKFQFQAEVNRMMTLIINSLYRNKEIFLRELISNASDALDKIRFLSLTNPALLGGASEFSIKIKADKENNVLHIIDTGIGMTKNDLKNNLGTLAKSGTAEFLKKMEQTGDVSLIGQFGVGFYSVFLVADHVTVTSKHPEDKQYIWESTADSDFTIVEDPRGDTLGRGTKISLYLKPEAADYLNEETLRGLISKYSEFINFPIYLRTTKTESVEVPLEEGEEAPEDEEEPEDEVPEDDDDDDDDDDDEDEEDEEKEEKEEKPKTKKVEKTTTEFEQINKSKPIWLRPTSDVSEEEYNEFFKSFFKEGEDPLAHSHFKGEGEVEFKSILYVPGKAPSNLYSSEVKIDNIKLFVKRVFITDTDMEPLLPNYLRFIKGIVDSDDLPLNVSRETLQQHKLLKVIKKRLTRKALDMFKDLAEKDADKYKTFYKEYATSIKLGVIEDHANKDRIVKLLRFQTSDSKNEFISLEQYVKNMKKGQKDIYFLSGASLEEVKGSPFLERLIARGYEVLFLVDPIDEYAFQSVTEYDGHKFMNIAKEGLEFGDEDDQVKEQAEKTTEQFKPLTEWFAKVLSSKIDKAVISNRLTTSPCALVASKWGWSGNMERIMTAQAYASKNDAMASFYAKQKKTLEINPKHPVILELLKKVEAEAVDDSSADIAKILFDTAALRSGYTLQDSVEFANLIEKVVRGNLGVDLSLQVEVNEKKAEPQDEKKEDEEEEEEEEEIKAEEIVHEEL